MDNKDLCEHTRIRLIAAAIGHQQCTKTAANIVPIPGGDRVIAIGTPAQVRALLPVDTAQPESATGTTGASVDTLEFQALAGTWCGAAQSCDQWTRTVGAKQAWADMIAHIDAIIAGLRAQLAAKGQGEPVAWIRFCSDGCYEGPIMHSAMEEVRKKSGAWSPLYLAAPASAQPADLERDYQADYQYLLGLRAGWNLSQQRDVEGFNAALVARQACLDDAKRDLKAGAQPDRGAAQGADVCAEMRALCSNCGGTGEVHRADGEYVGTCDCMFQTIASPASQPVAPQTVSDERREFDAYWNALDDGGATDAELEMCEYAAWQAWQARPRRCLALPLSSYPAGTTYKPAAVAPSDAKGKAEELTYTVDGIVMTPLEYIDHLHTQPAAVVPSSPAAPDDLASLIRYPECWDTVAYPTLTTALQECVDAFRIAIEAAASPSDAKGKADAANAGKPPLPPADQHTAIGARLFLVSTLCSYGTACFQAGEQYARQQVQSPATSAADAKDAARWRALLASARIQPQGNAGLDGSALDPYGKPWGGYAHMGLEIWTTYSRDFSPALLEKMDRSTATGRDWLTRYADIAIDAQHAAMAAAPSSEKGGDK